MSRQQIGKPNKHVNESYGAGNNIMKFYITEYSSRLGIDDFTPQKGSCEGTGYKSNFRPGVYYTRKLDELDNPTMGKIVDKNYKSLTHKDYQPSRGHSGKEPLPLSTQTASTGFSKEHQTVPTEREAYAMFPNLAMSSYKEKTPLLHTLKNKDPIAAENARSGPAYSSTESHTQFTKKHSHIETDDKITGPLENTGFTRAKNPEPVTHYPEANHKSVQPTLKSYLNPIVPSIMKTSYQPHQHSDGRERLSGISKHANPDTGFTRFIQPTGAHTAAKGKVYTTLGEVDNPFTVERTKKSDPAEYLNMTNPHPYPSLSKSIYNGQQTNEPALNEKLGNVSIGRKENTGHTDNNKSFWSTPNDSEQYKTVYNDTFFDKNRIPETERSRINDDCTRDLQGDGFTKSEKLHPALGSYDEGSQLRFLHPYVNRSIKARDPFYGETKYAHKSRPLLLA
ncbi:stabilizer of axonemal microtubules 4-like [Clytia hemisphaerica]|uniref:Uncharacterized protein n=1 Tax=Clytia hemisphaerica TaxID=252671 RepID=A0A7M6DJS0_9CNID|eukprot:TCONS_00011557-protein